MDITDDDFHAIIAQAMEELPGEHVRNIQNVAIVTQDEPTPEQILKLQLRHDQSLLGLYEGVPLTQRQGGTRILPDKITLFKGPLMRHAVVPQRLKEEVKHTIWHEIAHYYGLNHDQIRNLE